VLERLETYLRGVFGFIGVGDPEFIVAEGLITGAPCSAHCRPPTHFAPPEAN
jgi:FMN-dependent NADH-azoreductase